MSVALEKEFIVDESQLGKRLDALISELDLGVEISRSYSKQLIEEAAITVNTKANKPSYKVKLGDKIYLALPEPKLLSVEAEDIPLDIVYEDDDLMLINKQAGMITHPAPGVYSGTLVNAVLFHLTKGGNLSEKSPYARLASSEQAELTDASMMTAKNECNAADGAFRASLKLSDINGVLRPGIVHRLDKDTTGLILVAKSNKAHQSLSEQIKARTCSRIYTCIIQGKLKESKITVSRAIGRHPKERIRMQSFDSLGASPNARHAKTHFKLKDSFTHKSKNYSLLEAKLDTGRTHQIRVHLSHLRKPIVGDFLYGATDKDSFKVTRPLLHSTKIKFTHPITDEEMTFTTELPDDMAKILKLLRAS